MSDDAPWMDKPTFMAHIGKSERTVQLWTAQGKVERQIIDGKAYYRKAALHPVTVQHPPQRSDQAAEIAELKALVLALHEKIDALNTPQLGRNTVTPPQRGWWARLFGGRK